jgi:Rrf2 family protein
MPDNSRLTIALHILTLLGVNEQSVCSSSMIANSINTNPVVVRRVLGILRAAGFVESLSGAEGGARLARPAEAISVAAVYRAVDTGALFPLHHQPPNQMCPCGCNIQGLLQDVYKQVEEAVEQTLGGTTVADLVRGIRERGGLTDD